MVKSYYDVLGVPRNATQGEIDKAYKEKAQTMHPDKGGEHESFIELSKAYDTLKDPQKRKIYDTTGEDGQKTVSIHDAAVDTIKILATQLVTNQDVINKPDADILHIIRQHIKREIKTCNVSINKLKTHMLTFGGMKSKVHSAVKSAFGEQLAPLLVV